MSRADPGAGHYWQLIRFRAYAELRTEASRTYIGFLWWVLDPALTLAIFYLLFGVIRDPGRPQFFQFLIVGIVTWRWFQGTVSNAANSVWQNRALVQRVVLPKQIFPLTVALIDLAKFSIVFMILLVVLAFSGYPPTCNWLLLLPLLLTQATLIVGAAFLASAVVPFIPDLKHLIDHGLMLAFFLSGVFFSIQDVPPAHQWVFAVNPMATLIEGYRAVLLGGDALTHQQLLYPAVFGLTCLLVGHHTLSRFGNRYAKVMGTG